MATPNAPALVNTPFPWALDRDRRLWSLKPFEGNYSALDCNQSQFGPAVLVADLGVSLPADPTPEQIAEVVANYRLIRASGKLFDACRAAFRSMRNCEHFGIKGQALLQTISEALVLATEGD